MLVSKSCAAELETPFSIISTVPCWLGVIGTGIKKKPKIIVLVTTTKHGLPEVFPRSKLWEGCSTVKKSIQIKMEECSLNVVVED